MRRPLCLIPLITCGCRLAAQNSASLDPYALYTLHRARLLNTDPRKPANDPNAFAWAVIAKAQTVARQNLAVQKMACDLGQDRVTQQIGAPAGALGSTTVTEKSDLPDVVAAAFESGGVTRTVSGNAVTFSLNGDGIYKFLTGQNLCVPEGWGLKDFSAFATFQTSDPGTQSATVADPATGKNQSITFLPDPHTLNAAGLQWAINNPHDSSNVAARQDFVDALQDLVNSVPQSEFLAVFESMRGRAEFEEYLNGLQQLPAGKDPKADVLASAARAIRADALLPMRLAATAARFRALIPAQTRFSLANSGLAFSVKYGYNKPYNQNAIHNAKVIVNYTPKSKLVSVTGNFGVDVFGNGMQSGIRDLQVSASALRPIPAIEGMPAQVSLAVYYQYQKENALLVFGPGNSVQGISLPDAASTLLAPKGNIFIAQALLTLTKNNTALVPIGFTYSNRTELLTGSEIRGHVGIQFNGLKELFNGSSLK